jgi:hypothetical protein
VPLAEATAIGWLQPKSDADGPRFAEYRRELRIDLVGGETARLTIGGAGGPLAGRLITVILTGVSPFASRPHDPQRLSPERKAQRSWWVVTVRFSPQEEGLP